MLGLPEDRVNLRGPCPRRAVAPRWTAERAAAAGWIGAGCDPHSPPQRATIRQPGGRARRRTHRFRREPPRAAVWSGWCQVDAMPHTPGSKIIGGPGPPLRNLVESASDQEPDVSASGHTIDRSATEDPLRLHQLVHQRRRTTVDVLGPESDDEARPRTTCR